MSAQYVNHGARIKCTCGSKISNIQVLPDRTVTLTDGHYANISDHQSMINIPPFGVCQSLKYPPTKSATDAHHGSLTPMPCKPGTYSVWENGNDSYIIRHFPALLTCSSCRCIYGGVITIVTDGQIPNQFESERKQDFKEEYLDDSSSDSNEERGIDVIDFIPVVGSIRDIGDGIAAGSMGLVALGTVFLVADVVGVVGSFFSGGAASVGVTAAKSSIKAGIKVTAKTATKTVAKETTKQTVKQGEKKLLELTARGATEGATKLSVEAAEELGEAAFKELSPNIFKPNIFKVETKVAETGAKEAPKSTKAANQVINTTSELGKSAKGTLDTAMKQLKEVAEAGRESLKAAGRQIERDYGIKKGIKEFFNNVDKIQSELPKAQRQYEAMLKAMGRL